VDRLQTQCREGEGELAKVRAELAHVQKQLAALLLWKEAHEMIVTATAEALE
jgi:hypothetical protein